MGHKLENKKGESLVETLVAILIFTLASIILYTMVTTAARVNLQTRQREEIILEQLSAAEKAQSEPDAPARTGTVTMVINGQQGSAFQIPVEIFGGEADEEGNPGLHSYLRKAAGN